MKTLLLLVVCLVVSCGGSNGKNSSRERTGYSTTDSLKVDLLDLVNEHRSKIGLKKLVLAQPLTKEIQGHTDKMASYQVPLGHSGMSLRCANAKAAMGGGNLCGEIVAKSAEGAKADDVYSQWMNSVGHRAKIEEPRYTRVGIGMSLDKENELYSGMLFLEY